MCCILNCLVGSCNSSHSHLTPGQRFTNNAVFLRECFVDCSHFCHRRCLSEESPVRQTNLGPSTGSTSPFVFLAGLVAWSPAESRRDGPSKPIPSGECGRGSKHRLIARPACHRKLGLFKNRYNSRHYKSFTT